MKHLTTLIRAGLLVGLALLLSRASVPAQTVGYGVGGYRVAGGGGTSGNGTYTMSGTAGQPEAGTASSGSFTLVAGFWGTEGAPAGPLPTGTPTTTAVPGGTATPTATATSLPAGTPTTTAVPGGTATPSATATSLPAGMMEQRLWVPMVLKGAAAGW